MEKISFHELCENKEWEQAVIVYKIENWNREYPLESRSYMVNHSCKYFDHNMIGKSLYGYSLDGTDLGVRLDHYNWDVEYCYIIE